MRTSFFSLFFLLSALIAPSTAMAQGLTTGLLTTLSGDAPSAVVPKPSDRLTLPPPRPTTVIFVNPFPVTVEVIITIKVDGELTSVQAEIVPSVSEIPNVGPVVSVKPKDGPGIVITNSSIELAGPGGSTILADAWFFSCTGIEEPASPGCVVVPGGVIF